ncbi:hypothetical protein FA95DRAFT_1558668 [Auriscalpium vulgare]|uniref:Uncharacterized protein n=1 Tax=Auriscalpium vulgare TaxID=40419 RepID=A0ACB8RVC0_9AGAM|nr:hypothetical protein FA95DRAFT_1558668 [Auriscalpium vulgare]
MSVGSESALPWGIPSLIPENRVRVNYKVIPSDAFVASPEYPDFQRSLGASSLAEIAAAARLWEELLDRNRDSFLLLRVADVRNVLNSKFTALRLYREAQQTVGAQGDPRFDQWLDTFEKETVAAMTQNQSIWNKAAIAASQRWKSIVGAPLPYIRLPKAHLQQLQSRCASLGSTSEPLYRAYLNLHCIETNVIEGAFVLGDVAIKRLIKTGFFDPEATILHPYEVGSSGDVQDCSTIINILKDTRTALDEVIERVSAERFELTSTAVCHLHAILMRSCRVLCVSSPGSAPRLTYTNVGQTRQATKTNVTIQTSQKTYIQFCPHAAVDRELDAVAKVITDPELKNKHDPFAFAAYISDLFVSVHPFEDGNGRMSRLLASIPLLEAGLPPLSISLSAKLRYHQHLNAVRAARDGDYELLAKFLFDTTLASIGFVMENR